MKNNGEVISAFLDDEPFAPEDLVNALSEPAGRTLLIDLVMLRRVVQPAVPPSSMRAASPAPRVRWQVAAAAAALFVSLAGGYFAGHYRASPAFVEAPPATRVVQASPFVPPGGHQ